MRSGRHLQVSPLLPYIAVNIKLYRHILRALTLVNHENYLITQCNCVGFSIEQDIVDTKPPNRIDDPEVVIQIINVVLCKVCFMPSRY